MLDQPKKNGHSNGNGGLVVEDLQNLTFSVHRKVFVSPEILEDENRAIFDKMLDLCRPRLGGEEPRRFPHPPCRRPSGDLLPRPARARSARCSTSAAIAARWFAASARATPGSSTASITAGPTTPTARSRAFRATTPIRRASTSRARASCRCRGSSTTRISISPTSIPTRSTCTPISPAPRTTSTSSSTSRRPADGDHLRHAGIRHQGELEAAGREQRRRLSPRHHAFDLAQLHAQLRRQRHAGQGPHAADQGLRQGPRQRPSHHRQSELSRPPGGALDFGLSARRPRPTSTRSARSWSTRLGEARAARVADTNRNLCIFPNLVINDGSSVTVRHFTPVAPDLMHVTAWALGPVEETEAQRARRLHAFLTFYGPGGFATPDDVAALELAQQGYAAWREVPWTDLSRGMGSQPGAARHRRRPSARVLAQVERADGGSGA